MSPAGSNFWLVAGLPAGPFSTPFGDLSISPQAVVLVAAGTQGPSERFAWSTTIPPVNALRGAALGLQAAAWYVSTQVVEYSSLVVAVIE